MGTGQEAILRAMEETQETPPAGKPSTQPGAKVRRSRRLLRWALVGILLLPGFLWLSRGILLHPLVSTLTPWAGGQFLNARCSLEEISGDWWHGLKLRGVQLQGDQGLGGLRSFKAQEVRLEWDLGEWVRGEPSWLRLIAIQQPLIELTLKGGDPNSPSTGLPSIPLWFPAIQITDSSIDMEASGGALSIRNLGILGRPEGEVWQGDLGPFDCKWTTPGQEPLALTLAMDLNWDGRVLELEAVELDNAPILGPSTVRLDHLAEGAFEFSLRPLGPLAGGHIHGVMEGQAVGIGVDLKRVDLAELRGLLNPLLATILPADTLILGSASLDAAISLNLNDLLASSGSVRLLGENLRVGGTVLSDLEVRAQLADGIWTVPEIDARSPKNILYGRDLSAPLSTSHGPEFLRDITGILRAEGTNLPAFWGDADHEHPDHRFDLALTVAEGKLQVSEGQLEVSGGNARIDRAVIDLVPKANTPATIEADLELDFPELSALGELLDQPQWSGQLEGELHAQGELLRPEGVIRLNGIGVRFGDVDMGDLQILARADHERITLTDFHTKASGAQVDATGSFLWSGQRLEQVQLAVSVTEAGRWLMPVEPGGSFELRAQLDGPWKLPSGEISVLGDGLVLQGSPLKAVDLRAQVTNGVVSAPNLEISSEHLTVIAGLEASLPTTQGGTAITLTRLGFAVDGSGQLALANPAQLKLHPTGWNLERLSLVGPAGILEADLASDETGSLNAKIISRDLNPMGIINGWQLQTFHVEGVTSDLDLAWSNDGLRAETTGNIRQIQLPGSSQAMALEWDFFSGDGYLSINNLSLVSGTHPVVSASGSLPLNLLAEDLLSPGVADLAASIDWPETLPIPLGSHSLHGGLKGQLSVQGPWENLMAGLDLQAPALNLQGPNVPDEIANTPAVLVGSVTLGPTGLHVTDLLATVGPDTTLQLDGHLDLANDLYRWRAPDFQILDGAMSGEVEAHVPNMAQLQPLLPNLRRLGGNLDLSASLAGSLGDPRLDGQLVISEGQFKEGNAPPIERLHLRAQLETERIVVHELSGELGSAPFEGSGSLVFEEASEPTLLLDLKGTNVLLVRNSKLRLRADALLNIEGPLSALHTSGKIGLRGGRYTSRVQLLGGFDGSPTFESQISGVHIAPFPDGALANMTFDLDLSTIDPVRVDMNIFRGDATINMRLSGDGRGILPEGSVYLEDSVVNLPSGQLELIAGHLEFTAGNPFFPAIEVLSESRLMGHDVTVQVSGNIDQPLVQLSSVPALAPDELLLLVVTGTLPAGSGLNEAVQAVTVYIAQDLIQYWLDDGGQGPSIADRLEVESGRNVSETGLVTIEARLRLRDEFLYSGGHLWLVAERDRYEAYGGGLRFSLDLD